MKKALLFILLFITCTVTSSYAKNILLQSPPKISEEIIDEMIIKSASTKKMTWVSCINSQSCIRFSITFAANNNSRFQLALTGSKFINELTEKEVSLFKKKANTWTYSYGSVVNKQANKQKKVKMFAQPLFIQQAHTIRLSISEVSELINGKNVIFYTGAGISSPVVPDMIELMSQLKILYNQNSGIDKFTHIIRFIHRTLKESDEVIEIIDNFQEACLYGNPTPAHRAVKNIVLLKNWQLLTENIDLLHQRSGIQPLGRVGRTDRVDFYWLKRNIRSKHLRQIDFIITAGLNSDEVGFLALYKKHNPKGKIIAINLVQPGYLSNDDILVLEDVQKTLPGLFEALSQAT